MHPFAWWALLAPAALLAVSLTPSGAANAHPRAMAATGLSAGIVAFLVAIGVDAAVILYGPFWTGTLGVAGVGVGIYFDALSAAMLPLVSFIGVVVLLYSRNYLDGDPARPFFKRLAFTLAAVLSVIVSGNLALSDPRLDRHQRRPQQAAAVLPRAARRAARREQEVRRQPARRRLPDRRRRRLWSASARSTFPALFAAAKVAAAGGRCLDRSPSPRC